MKKRNVTRIARLAGLTAGAAAAALLGTHAALAIEAADQCQPPPAAACVELDMGGSSAGTIYATTVPLLMLQQNPTPIHYTNGPIPADAPGIPATIAAGKLHVWTGVGVATGLPTMIRYAATGSSDGIVKPQNYTTQTMLLLNHFPNNGCVAAAAQKNIGGTNYNYTDVTGCIGNPAGGLGDVNYPVVADNIELGASDTRGTSFHQVGGGVVNPLPETGLDHTSPAVVPFKFILGKGVKRNVGGVLVNVDSLSRYEVEGLLSADIDNWGQIGLVVDADGNGVADANDAVIRCMRAAGSGTKATLDETVMKDASETVLGTTDLTDPTPLNNAYFGKSTQDVRDCIQGADLNSNGVAEFPNDADSTTGDRPPHPNAIGYMDADAFVVDSPAPFGDADTDPEGYDVKYEGYFAYDLALTDPQANLKCGRYGYWVNWELFYPTVDPAGLTADMKNTRNDFVAKAAATGVNQYWVLPGDMHVFKNADPGPVLFNPGANPC